MRIKGACCCVSNIIPLCSLCVSLSTILRVRDYSLENTCVCLSSNNSSCTWYRAHLHVHTYQRSFLNVIFAIFEICLRYALFNALCVCAFHVIVVPLCRIILLMLFYWINYTISEKENIKKSSVRIFCKFIFDLINCEMV